MNADLTPEQRAELALSEGWGMSRQFQVRAIADAIRDAQAAERHRCIETLRDMGMHETAMMLRVTLEASHDR